MKDMHSSYALNLINLLTLEEKIALVAGHNSMYTNAIHRLNIPSIRMSDGPHGLRVQVVGDVGAVGSSHATCFPTSATSSNSWNVDLLKEMGNAMALEAKHYGIDVILGPGVNIKRNPLCGRNFEYFSEDPLLAGSLGAGFVNGIQEKGMGVAVKHFALNNEENHRFIGDSLVDVRAAREIYLKPFEYIVKHAHPESLMNAYNKINGVYCTENKWLLTDILRNEWGFTGLDMTDWGATHNRIDGIKAGNDLEMPGDTLICRKWIKDAINNGTLDIKELDERVLNVLDLVSKHLVKEDTKELDWNKHHLLASKIAEESAVLLKNNNNVLPLGKEEKLCIIGQLFMKMRYQGSGSSMISTTIINSPKEEFDKNKVDYVYYQGYKDNESEPNLTLIDEAVKGADNFDKVLLFIGLTDEEESEGGDRDTMSLPKNQLALVDALIKASKKIVVVLFGGSVSELPFFDKIEGMFNMFLPGQNGGRATYNLIFGNVNPSGRLSETWPLQYKDVPFGDEFGKNRQVVYKESIYVGYRYYASFNKEIRFPFGYGLSYTDFSYRGLNVVVGKNNINVKVKVKNIGKLTGKEIVQIYVKGPETDFYKPIRELKGFKKIELKANEEKEVEITINKEDLRYWNLKENKYSLEEGEYVIEVGRNALDIVLAESINLKGENLNDVYSKEVIKAYKKQEIFEISDDIFMKMSGLKIDYNKKVTPITLESRVMDLRKSFFGRILRRYVLNTLKKDLKEAKKLPKGPERDNRIKGALAVIMMVETTSLLSLSMTSNGAFPYNYAEGFRDLSNFHIIRAIKDFKNKIDAPKLPM